MATRRTVLSTLGIGALLGATVLAGCNAGSTSEVSPSLDEARIYASGRGQVLTLPSRLAPPTIVANFLRDRGLRVSAGQLRAVSENYRANKGLMHVRFEQEIDGMRIVGRYVKATITDRGELTHVIEQLANAPAAGLVAHDGTEQGALNAAIGYLGHRVVGKPVNLGREGNITRFGRAGVFYTEPTVERVAYVAKNGAVKPGFLVQTWTRAKNLLHHTIVDDAGNVIGTQLRTNTDRYYVYPIDPSKSGQVTVDGSTAADSTASPQGWLFPGTHKSIHIRGNNVNAYLDADANNAPDAGGADVTDGNFDSASDLSQQPSTSTNQEVAVQNLFYLNNVIHDILYRHGFDEAAQNFQADNYGRGGRKARDGDPVNAEAQDGSGTDNANFATPGDGQSPRMQMYLWSPARDSQVVAGDSTYAAKMAAFGPALDVTGKTGGIVLVNDGTAPTSDGCEAITADLSGKIALIERGTCSFVTKVRNAQTAGAAGVIVFNNQGHSTIIAMGDDGTGSDITTSPAVMISQDDGATLSAQLPASGTMQALASPAPSRDGDLDSDIVFHEYGHGLTWRMIGNMSGAMAGAIGEGMSDVLAILINDDDVVGEYSYSNAGGIRRAPYTGYLSLRTYKDWTGTEVHDDGEIYAAIIWYLKDLFEQNNLTADDLLGYLVDGMNYTRSGPTVEKMRDGILQASPSAAHDCLIWEAFAKGGVGQGARARVRGSTVVITESFDVPSSCL